MLLPVRVAHVYLRAPVVTWTLIGVNVAMFVLTLVVGSGAVWPLVLDSHAFAPHQLLTSMFLHAGFLHLAMNMLFLWVYGHYVEERMGPWRFLAIYLTCGVVGSLVFVAFSGGSAVGASGAISGLMGFVLVGAPWAEVQVLFLWGPYNTATRTFDVAAFWLVGIWILFQVLSVASWGSHAAGIAYMAHIGGCLAGAAIAFGLRQPAMASSPWYLDPSPPGGGPQATKRLRHARGQRQRQEAAPRFVVDVQSIERAPSRVGLIRVLVKHLDLEPDVAHRRLEQVEQGATQAFTFEGPEAAAAFAREAWEHGARVRYDPPAVPDAPQPAPVSWEPPPAPEPAEGAERKDEAKEEPHEPKDAAKDESEDPSRPIRLSSGQVLDLAPDPDA